MVDKVLILAYNRRGSEILKGPTYPFTMRHKATRPTQYRHADTVRLIVTTREKFPRDVRWNRAIRRTLFRLLQPKSSKT